MIRICPKCNKEITCLRKDVTGDMEYYLSLNTQGDIQYERGEFEEIDSGFDEYWCPECNEVLFREKTEAIAFLKGE